jgi:hypothetical protein
MKCFFMPVIIGVTGIVTEILKRVFGSNTRKAFVRFSAKKQLY